MTRGIPQALAALCSLGLIAAAASGCGNTAKATNPSATATPAAKQVTKASTAATGPVKVALTQWKVAPSATAAAAGTVTFDVTNNGSIPHEMVVIQTDKPDGHLGSGARVPETGNVGETKDIAVGASKTIHVKLAAGHYALICNIAGHYGAGMHADFTVN